MRIDKILFEKVGRWRNRPLDFVPGLNLVWGANEAGKSTARRAIEALLFPAARNDAMPLTELAKPLRPGEFLASIEVSRERDGAVETGGWKRHGWKFRDVNGGELPDEAVRRWLWETEQADFHTVYALGHDGLRDGSRLLGAGGALGRILIELSGGLDVGRVRGELEQELDKQFSSSGNAKNRSFNAAFNDVAELIRRSRELESKSAYDGYRDALAEQARQRERLGDAKRESARIKEGINELNRLLFAPALLDDVKGLEAQLASLRSAGPVPSRAWRARAGELNADLVGLGRELEEARREEAGEEAGLEGRTPSARILEHEEALRTVLQRRELLEKFGAKHGAHAKAAEGAFDQLVEVLRELGLSATREEIAAHASSFVLPPATAKRLGLAQRELVGGTSAAASAEAEREAARTEALGRAEELSRLGARQDVAHLRALRESSSLKTLEDALDERQRRLEKLRVGLVARAGRLGFPRPDDVAACAGTAIPGERESAVVVERWHAAEKALGEAALAHQSATKESVDSKRRLRELEARVAPNARREELPRLREERDLAWSFARRASLEPASDEAGRFARVEAAFAAHEKAARAVDDTVDALLAAASFLEALAQARRQVDEATGAVAEAAANVETKQRDVEIVEREWRALWTASGLAPPRVDETGWRGEHRQLVDDFHAWSGETAEATALVRKLDERRRALIDVLPDLRALADAPGAQLDRALAEEIQQRETINTRLDAAERELTKAQRLVEMKTRAAEEARRVADQKTQAFRELATNLAPKLIRDAPEALAAWAERAENVSQRAAAWRKATAEHDEHATEHETALAELERLRARLEASGVAGLASLGDRAPLDQLTALQKLLDDAGTTRERESRLQKRREQVRTLDGRRRAAMGAWATLLAEAGAETAGDPDSESCRDLLERLDLIFSTEARVAEKKASSPLPFEELERRVAGRTKSELEAALEELREQEKRAEDEVMRRADDERRATEKLAEIRAAGDLAEVRQKYEAASEKLVVELEETLALQGALALIAQAQDELQKDEAQARVLELASAHLARLTRGSFVRVEAGNETDAQLHVVRGGEDGESLEAKELSDGTRDQLWLALRLALIEQHLSVKRLPLVLDDLLVHFDDERALAALQAFAELARHTQVLLFTHHEHLVRLAENAGLAFKSIRLDAPAAEGEVPAPVPIQPDVPEPSRAPLLPGPVIRGPLGDPSDQDELVRVLTEAGGNASNRKLRELLGWEKARYDANKNELILTGRILPAEGQGRSVRLPDAPGD